MATIASAPERFMSSRITSASFSFRRFLGYPDRVPDSTTIWLFRERLAETGKNKLVWAELQRQLDERGLRT